MTQPQINLLTKEFRTGGSSIMTGVITWVSIVLVLVMVMIGAWQVVYFINLSSQQASLSADAAISDRKAAQVLKLESVQEGIYSRQRLLQRIKNPAQSKASLLSLIQSETPAAITITNLDIKSDGSINLQVNATDLLDVEKFVDTLRNNQQSFGSVDLQSLNMPIGKPIQAIVNCKKGAGVK